ncbi:MAG: DUF1800 domain-containing protein [Alphaproteobacteria bacterium]|nr:DUF1800 domain-containing protein [Alphaproteobacteria bacterium]
MPSASPSSERIALNRMGFGARPGDEDRVRAIGLPTYIEQQLRPPPVTDDPLTQARLADATLRISYGAGTNYPAVAEDRRLATLGLRMPDLWSIQQKASQGMLPSTEVRRAVEELRAATWIRAVHSEWQLREVMAGFWHDHFNVNALTDNRILVSMVAYDRDAIRAHALGNFRRMLEAVATSTAMLLYLNNAQSQATRPNENYAREAMELHSLGCPAYLGHSYNDWWMVPGAPAGQPVGFLDEDVFGAAKAFSGWTVAMNQRITNALRLADNGTFVYVPQFHSNAAARVLATDLSPYEQPMTAGRKVLDLLAQHPATASFIAGKVVRRLIGPKASQGLIDRAAGAFAANPHAPDQIARMLRAILLDPEFIAEPGQKLRRPFERAVALLRATYAEIRPTATLFRTHEQTGEKLFAWPTPDGHPDDEPSWLGSNQELKTWNMLLALFGTNMGTSSALGPQTQTSGDANQAILFWSGRLLGHHFSAASHQALLDDALVAGGLRDGLRLGGTRLETALQRVLGLMAASDEFAYR